MADGTAEAPLPAMEGRLVPRGPGWFVVNVAAPVPTALDVRL